MVQRREVLHGLRSKERSPRSFLRALYNKALAYHLLGYKNEASMVYEYVWAAKEVEILISTNEVMV